MLVPTVGCCFSTDENFTEIFSEGSPKEHFCKIISKSDQPFQKRRIFKNFLMGTLCKKPPSTRVMFRDRSKFCEQGLKKVAQGTSL